MISAVLAWWRPVMPFPGKNRSKQVRAARVAAQNDFSMFEYFLTDHIGHRQDEQVAVECLQNLDRYLAAAGVDLNETLVVISSDHGNIEDLRSNVHTSIRSRPSCSVAGGQRSPKDTQSYGYHAGDL